ncbi:hypothetical protein BDK88_4250 [Natrinema hispanicum]|uniref:Uncharacterized protein n=1 Tax=Natrinema hispanicum TaxID=392421 RepID=A0A482Y6Z9_9EURY|nr:hypothetical protein BDK88_4250 [Natrinema hispanicum]
MIGVFDRFAHLLTGQFTVAVGGSNQWESSLTPVENKV